LVEKAGWQTGVFGEAKAMAIVEMREDGEVSRAKSHDQFFLTEKGPGVWGKLSY